MTQPFSSDHPPQASSPHCSHHVPPSTPFRAVAPRLWLEDQREGFHHPRPAASLSRLGQPRALKFPSQAPCSGWWAQLSKMSGNGREKDKVSMRNVAGEIMGAISVIERAIKIGATKIVICYDYQGIEQFALGNWKRNNAYTKEYYDFIQKAKEKIEIEFEKIKAHTGDVYNEMVDRMAKRAVGI